MPLANLCIHAATTYWNYLDQNIKGVIEHQVLAKHDKGDGAIGGCEGAFQREALSGGE